MKNKTEFIYLAILFLATIYAHCITNSVTFEPVYSPYSDSSELYTVQSITDSTLFKNDPALIAIKNHMNWTSKIREYTHNAIFCFFMLFFSFPLTIKIVSIIITILSVILVYKIGVYLHSKNCALLLAGLFIFYFFSMHTFYGGQDRCFGAFIFCIFMLLLVKERLAFLPFLLPLIIIFYQSLFPLLATICLLVPILYFKRMRIKQFLLFLIINILICFLLVYTDKLQGSIAANLALLKSYKYLHDNNLVNPANPYHIILYFILNLNEHSRLQSYFTYFFLLLSLAIIVFRGKRAFFLHKAIWLMLAASFISFLLTYFFNPVLASRQFLFSLPMFLVLFVAANIYVFTAKIRINPAALLIPLMAVFMALHPILGGPIRDFRIYKPVYDYLENLPKEAFIAGHPSSFVLDNIPLFSRRTIFFSDNMDDILYLTYGREGFKERRSELILALYAESMEKVKKLITKYKIDFFVIEESYYNKDFYRNLKYSVIPYDKQTWALIEPNAYKGKSFLLNFAKRNKDFALKTSKGYIFVINTKKMLDNE